MNDYSAIDERLRVCGTCGRLATEVDGYLCSLMVPDECCDEWGVIPGKGYEYERGPTQACAFTPSEWVPYYEQDKERFQTKER